MVSNLTFEARLATFAVEPIEDEDIFGSFGLAELIIFESLDFVAIPLPFDQYMFKI